MASSIRGTLLGWYGLIVGGVIIGFGANLHARASSAMLETIDASLTSRAEALAAALEWDPEDGWELELSDDYLTAVAESLRFGVWTPEGHLVRARGLTASEAGAAATGYRERGGWRELLLRDARGSVVIVAHSLDEYQSRRRGLVWGLAGAGLGALAVALLGGWWLASRTLAPISQMTATAASISERDFAGRVSLDHTPDELRALAATLNDTFSRLEAAFGRQKRFTADASHELRTPLSVIGTQVELALSRDRSGDSYRETLRACRRAATRMGRVVDRLLHLARTDADAGTAAHTAVDLRQLVLDGVELLRPQVEARQLSLSHELHPATVRGDADRLGVVIANLMSNALEHSRPGGSIELRLSAAEGRARLTVRDTGIGIPAGALPLVFEPFYRVDDARSRDRGGAGLGLAIVESIVQAHAGAVSVESVEGRGTSFAVVLPTAAEAPGPPAAG